MSVWLDSSSNSNKFKQSYFRDFVDVSGDILVRNGLSLKLYNNNIPTRVQFSVNSKEFHIYNDTDQTYYDISNTKLIHLQDLSENVQSKLNQVNTLQTALNSKANASVVDTSFTSVNNAIATKVSIGALDASFAAVNNAIATKVSIGALDASFAAVNNAIATKVSIGALDASFTSVNNAIATKAPLANPTFTGTINASKVLISSDASFVGRVDICGNIFAATATAGANTTQLATTAFVTTAVSTKADLVNPTFTGNVRISDSNGMTVLLKSVGITLPLVSPMQLGQDIDGEASLDEFGYAVSMNSDGTIVAIGALLNDGTTGTSTDNRGHVRVYKYDVNKLTDVTDQASPDFGPVGWRRLGQDIDGEAAGDQSGFSVSLSADGTTVAIGANQNDATSANDIRVGHVRVYKYVSTKLTGETDQSSPNFGPAGWTRLGQDIDGEAADDQFGRSVSLNTDGTILAIGAIRNDGTPVGADRGHVRIYKYQTIADTTWTNYNATNFTYNGTTNNKPIVVAGGDATPVANKYYWVQMGVDIDGEATGDWCGVAVSMNSDGTIVAIGSSLNDGTSGLSTDNRGHVRVYKYDVNKLTSITDQNSADFGPIGWRRLGQDIDGEAAGDQFGRSVSISDDGTIVAIGAPNNDGTTGTSTDNRGHVRIYKYDVNKLTDVTDQASPDFGPVGWRRLGQDIDGEADGDQSGFSVSLSADGTTVAIGAYVNLGTPGRAVRGHVRIYKYDGISWNQILVDIDGEDSNNQSGWSVSLSKDGTTVAIGANYNDGTTGTSTDNRGHVRVYQIQSIAPSKLQISNSVDICGNFYAQYPAASIPANAIIGGVGGGGGGGSSATDISVNSLTVGRGSGTNTTNSAYGFQVLGSNTTGTNNTATGYQALLLNSTGANNTAIGYQAGDLNTTGSNNTFLGSLTDTSGTTWSNSTAIGYNAKITASNQIILGTTTETVRVPGKLSITSDASFNGRVDVCGNFYANYPANSIPSSAIIGGVSGGSSFDYAQVDASLNLKANLESPTFTGTVTTSKILSGDASFNGRVDVCGNFYAQYPAASIPASAINGISSAIQTAIDLKATKTIVDTSFTSVNTAIALKANLASPALTGLPTAPTANADTNTTQLATTAFVMTAVSTKANLESPALTGLPTAPTASAGTNTAQLATTAFVKTAVDNLVASAPAALDTLNELAAALGNDAAFSTTVTNSLASKAPLANPTFTGTVTASKVAISSDASFSGRVDICGNFYAQYPASSIPSSAIIGGTGSSINLNADISVNSITVGRGGGNDLYSTAIGYQALTSSTSGDAYNTAVGYRALASNTNGNFNTAVGVNALQSNQGGAFNVAIGTSSLNANQSGNNNIALNWGALLANIIGNDNIAVGKEALKVNQTGNNNIAIGTLALHNSTSSNSSAIGWSALQSSSGTANTAFGYLAGGSNTTGEYNTFIGYGSDTSGTSFSNSSAIGANAKITASNQITLGTSTETVYIPGKLSVVGELSLISNLLVSKDTSFNSKLFVGGNATMNSKLTVASDASFSGRVDICGNFYAQYPPNSIPASAIIGGVGGGGGAVSPISSFGTNITFDNNFALIKEAVVDPMSMLLRQFQF